VAKVGTFLGLISPVLALGVVVLMLFGSGYSYQSGKCGSGAGNLSSGSECGYESGTISALRYAAEEGDYAWLFWSGFIVVVCLIAAVGALVGRVALIWGCSIALYILAVLGMMSIGLFVFPLAMVLFVSAILLTVARPDARPT
jgi:hypothetical protein